MESGAFVRALVAILWIAAPAAAQWLVDPHSGTGRRMVEAFDRQWKQPPARPMRCRIQPFRPFLDYGLRVWAGYNVAIPASSLLEGDPPREVVSVARVTPLAPAAEPVHLYQRLSVPDPPREADLRKVEMILDGGWLLGRGDYRVELLVFATGGGECRGQWKVKVRLDGAAQPPASVRALDSGLWQGFDGNGKGHAAIFLHASPVRPRRYATRLSPWDRQVLLSTLSAVLRDGGFRSASLVVFDLVKREVIFEQDQLRPEDVNRLARQLTRIDFGTIAFDTLRSGPLPGDFLQDLVRRRLRAERAPDALVFIGSRWRSGPKVRLVDPALKEAAPPAWMLAYSQPQRAEDADALSSLVKALGGKVISVYSPSDLAPALREIRQSRR